MRKRGFKAPTANQLKVLLYFQGLYDNEGGPEISLKELARACHAAALEVKFLRKEWKRCVVLDPDERY